MSRERLQIEIQRHLDALYAEGKKDSATISPPEVLHHTLLLERAYSCPSDSFQRIHATAKTRKTWRSRFSAPCAPAGSARAAASTNGL
jgi:hypothetical protein